jgi:diguanylate cyclase (GGDEF)-like protein/PAS domain S-box-containing protein
VDAGVEDRGLRRTRRLTEVFAWVTAVGALGAVAGAPAAIPVRAALAALILGVLGWWGWRRRGGSWWLVSAEAVVITVGCLVLPTPQPMLGLLFGVTTRRAVRGELGPRFVRALPAFLGYASAAVWHLVAGGSTPDQAAPVLLPLLGLVIGTIALGDTVSAVDTAAAALRDAAAANEHLDAVLRTSPVALVVLAPGGLVSMCNDESRALFGWSAGGGRVIPCPHGADVTDCPRRCLDTARADQTSEWEYERADGTSRTLVVRVSDVPVGGVPGGSTGMLLAFLDISTRKELEDRLRRQVERDDLTGVVSRVGFVEVVRSALAAHRPGTRSALLLIDLDDFKDINDTYGHPTGDAFLVAAADQLRRAVADDGVVGRLGGDEFAVLVDTRDEDEAARWGERLLAALAATGSVAGLKADLRASVGIALAAGAPLTGPEPAAVLLRDADTAMYLAKRAGGNRVQVFHQQLRTTLLQRQHDEAELRCALADEQLVLHFQPIVDLRTGAVAGAEALMRWRHPERGLLPPGPVVELAEDTGLIVPLGTWALGAACRQAKRWERAGFGVRMSVNVSARQLHSTDFVDTVATALTDTGLSPGRLTLELTESALIRQSALAVLRDVRSLGVRVALDDFGTGYSSLSYLQRYPFDLIKIDRSFIGQLGEVATAEGIIRCILDLAEVLGIPVVGEGVETQAHADLLADCGCAFAQGYHYGRPAPADEWTDAMMVMAPSGN